MKLLNKVEVSPGIVWVEIPDADLRVLCGCPADSVKHLMRRGLIAPTQVAGVACETGPNAILLSDVLVQNGAFCNLAEFPVLQMLYRQGMILPGHPNNVGRKPLLIGRREIVDSQMQYIHRGNYGLVSEEEMIAAGVDAARARELMRLKLRFAFGRIRDPREMLDSAVLNEDGSRIEIAPGVTVRRTALNVFEFAYKGRTAVVDLNLPPFEDYECPYQLGFSQFRREYFAVVHSGEGDGWDVRRPSMGSIVVYQGRIYLVDAGPNLAHALTALGIGINEVEGVFQTHSHDDHFAGLTTLIQGDHRIKYFATPLVRAAVTKKLAALLGMEEADFHDYFDVVDLHAEEWNDIDGLDVRPVISPHPVETTVFFFRTMAGGGWHSYAHLADIVSLQSLEGMVTTDAEQPGISRAWFEQVRNAYLEPVTLKKVDIGGGMIHGNAADFQGDGSDRIVLAHTALKLTGDQRKIGSGTSFATVDVLVPSHRDFVWRTAFAFLHAYFLTVSSDHIHALLNGPIRSFNPETVLLREGETHDSIYLILTGEVEMLTGGSPVPHRLSAGALLGEITGLQELPGQSTYRAISFVQALEIPCDLYVTFVQRHELFPEISRLLESRRFLRSTWLCGGIMCNSTLNAVSKAMTAQPVAAGTEVTVDGDHIGIVKAGRLTRFLANLELENLHPGDFFGEEAAVFNGPVVTRLIAATDSEILTIPSRILTSIPNVRWKLFETFGRRARMRAALSLSEKILLTWQDTYSINVQHLDQQHRNLLETANRLVAEIAGGADREQVAGTLGMLLCQTLDHFAEEERLVSAHGYEDAGDHSARHGKVIADAREISQQFREGRVSNTELLEFLHKWVVNHILIEDRKLGGFLNDKGLY